MRPTEFAPGVTKGTGTMAPADWMVRWAEGLEPTPRNLTLRSRARRRRRRQSRTFRFHIPQYLMRRAKDWADRGFKETLIDWPSLNARSKFWGDDQRAAFKNWEEIDKPARAAEGHRREHSAARVPAPRAHEGDAGQQARRAHPGAHDAAARQDRAGAGAEPEQSRDLVSARTERGHHRDSDPGRIRARSAYDPAFELATDANGRKFYRSRTGTTPTEAPAPGMPFSINFLVEPGMEHLALKAATAYQSASRRRVPPPAFPALPGEP